MDPFDGLTLHPLAPADAERGFALSTEIGWNQTADDWFYMLSNGAGYGRTNDTGVLVASAMALPYGAFGWVCMVLVSPDYRRRGLATDLMNRVVEDLEADGVIPGLDATPAGREVYRQIGFTDIYGLERLHAAAVPVLGDESQRTPVRIEPLSAADIDELAGYDSVLFGGDRKALLAHLLTRQPDRAFAAWAGPWMAGYVLARDGREATQIGPVVAEDEDIAIALAERALRGLAGQVYIDAMAPNAAFTDWLKSSGFEFQRPYTRMLRGRDEPQDDVERIFAAAGPELG